MKWFKNIGTVTLLMIFLFSSTGFIVYKSHCACSGEEYTSIIVKPETCETTFHQHHKHDDVNKTITCSEQECHECHSSEGCCDSCGCDSPEYIFLKLKDKAVDDEAKFIVVQSAGLQVLCSDLLEELTTISEDKSGGNYYLDPPPLTQSSLDFLIQIQKLKIPSLA